MHFFFNCLLLLRYRCVALDLLIRCSQAGAGMVIKMKSISAEAAARHPGCAGIEAHALAETMRRQWLVVIGSGR